MNNGISYEDYLAAHDSLTYSNVGTSMLPLLRQGKDLFTVMKKGADRCKVGDVVLYRRPPSHYVLHRIVEVRECDYVILGDNCVSREYGIKDDDVIGIMTGFVRNGREYSTQDWRYRAYSFVWLHIIGIRIFFKRFMIAWARVVRKITKGVGR